MNTYFIRHKDENRKNLSKLLQNHKIAIFFEDIPWNQATDAEYWKSPERKNQKGSRYFTAYKTAVEFFKMLSKDGGQIFAEYENAILPNGKKGCLLGTVTPGTPVLEWDGCNTTLQLQNVVEVEYAKYPVLLAIRPPYGTICQPQRQTYAKLAESLLKHKPIQPDIELIHPSVAEQMCVEFLRIYGISEKEEDKLNYLFLNVGKTMATVDIAGRLNNNKKVFCQVKHGPIHDNTKKAFVEIIPKEAIGVIFANNVANEVIGNIHYINIKDIYQKILKDSPQMIIDMIGIESAA